MHGDELPHATHDNEGDKCGRPGADMDSPEGPTSGPRRHRRCARSCGRIPVDALAVDPDWPGEISTSVDIGNEVGSQGPANTTFDLLAVPAPVGEGVAGRFKSTGITVEKRPG